MMVIGIMKVCLMGTIIIKIPTRLTNGVESSTASLSPGLETAVVSSRSSDVRKYIRMSAGFIHFSWLPQVYSYNANGKSLHSYGSRKTHTSGLPMSHDAPHRSGGSTSRH